MKSTLAFGKTSEFILVYIIFEVQQWSPRGIYLSFPVLFLFECIIWNFYNLIYIKKID